MPAGRVEWLDAARGVGIILVVFGHVVIGMIDSHAVRGAPWEWTHYALYTFHMSMFFFLSGLNLPRSLRHGALDFLRSKVWAIAYPYFLWSIIQGTILVELSSVTTEHMGWHNITQIWWRPISQFWFLYALFVCQIMGLILHNRRWAMAGVAASSMIASQFIFPPTDLAAQTLHSLPFFLAGAVVPDARILRAPAHPVRISAGCLAVFVASVVAAAPLAHMQFNSIWCLPAAIFGAGTIIFGVRRLGVWEQRLAVLGRASMTIYILHILFAAGARILIGRSHLPIGAAGTILFATTVGVGVPFLIHSALDRMNLLWPVGLGPIPKTVVTPALA